MTVVKIIELIGSSEKSWEEAAQNAVNKCCETVKNVKGIDVISQTAKLENGKIIEYKTALKIAFVIK